MRSNDDQRECCSKHKGIFFSIFKQNYKNCLRNKKTTTQQNNDRDEESDSDSATEVSQFLFKTIQTKTKTKNLRYRATMMRQWRHLQAALHRHSTHLQRLVHRKRRFEFFLIDCGLQALMMRGAGASSTTSTPRALNASSSAVNKNNNNASSPNNVRSRAASTANVGAPLATSSSSSAGINKWKQVILHWFVSFDWLVGANATAAAAVEEEIEYTEEQLALIQITQVRLHLNEKKTAVFYNFFVVYRMLRFYLRRPIPMRWFDLHRQLVHIFDDVLNIDVE